MCRDGLRYSCHLRLGHINKDRISKPMREGLLPILGNKGYPICEPCLSGKMIKKHFPKGQRSAKLLEIIHSDICKALHVRTQMDEEHFITFKDDFCKYDYVYLIQHKHKLLKTFEQFATKYKTKKARK